MRVGLVGGRRAAVLAALCAVLALGAGAVAWALAAPRGAVGHDVSYPQCGTTLPTTGTFGIVGVNGGKVSTANPCLTGQDAWARRRSADPALYVNTGNPGAGSTFYWPATGARDPALCTDRTSAADPGCAYDYGWHGAADSLRIATRALGAGVTSRVWWLDVELANSWNGTPTADAASLQGAVDRLRSAGIPGVGIYSTSYQWGVITGGYRASNAATYRSAWARAFTPRFPMESAPLWVAGLGDLADARAHCSSSFTGAAVALAQYTDGAVDGDLDCRAAGTTTTPTTTTPPTTSRPTATLPSASRPTTTPPTTSRPTATATATLPTATLPTATLPTTIVPPVTTERPTTATPAVPSPVLTPAATTTPAPAGAVGAPTAVRAAAYRPGGVLLSWARPTGPTAPTVAGPVTRYVVLRGPGAGRESVLGVLTCTTPVCSWQDTAAVGRVVTWYRVAAVAPAGGVGPASTEVSARGR